MYVNEILENLEPTILEEQIKFYNYGREGVIPPEWEVYKLQCDHECAEFLRLKNKFEGK